MMNSRVAVPVSGCVAAGTWSEVVSTQPISGPRWLVDVDPLNEPQDVVRGDGELRLAWLICALSAGRPGRTAASSRCIASAAASARGWADLISCCSRSYVAFSSRPAARAGPAYPARPWPGSALRSRPLRRGWKSSSACCRRTRARSMPRSLARSIRSSSSIPSSASALVSRCAS